MSLLLDALGSAADLFLVVLGFSLIIFIHEAGHFFAAKWAGIRVLAFAIGFGPALVSYRKGLGVRRGSSEAEAARARASGRALSPTEYRLNILPLGGYVKMLGQEDADPSARSEEKDSYQNCPPLKRMVVISAGVIANIVTAAIAFVLVFSIGLKVEPAVVGEVEPGSPAARAMPSGSQTPGIAGPGLKTGDRVISVDGEATTHFNDLRFKVAYAAPQTPVIVRVQRPGVEQPIDFSILPEASRVERLLSIGVGPAASGTLPDAPSRRFRSAFAKAMKDQGYEGLEPGMSLVAIDGRATGDPYEIQRAATGSGGTPLTLEFAGGDETRKSIVVTPTPEFQQRIVTITGRGETPVDHLLGLTPVIGVRKVVEGSAAEKLGLQAGDVFARIGTTEFPSIPSGISEINRSKGTQVGVVVLRKGVDGVWDRKDLGTVKVSSEGTIGFMPRDSAELLAIVAPAWAESSAAAANEGSGGSGGPGGPGLTGGSVIVRVDGRAVKTLADVRERLRDAAASGTDATLKIGFRPPAGGDERSVDWAVSAADLKLVADLGWTSPITPMLFAPQQFALKADGIGDALGMGVQETHRTMAMTYLTFARLFQGTVKVDNLRGPVGIAHVGLSVADKGFVWLLFFFALISINLAVINFLPIPITDGGHMLFLLYEQITGKMVSVAVQNAATIAGLAVIGSLFLYVTFNDVSRVVKDLSSFLGQ